MTDIGVDAATLKLAGKTVTADLRQAITSAALSRTIDGASTLDLDVNDPDRKLIRSKLLTERTTANIDGALFELVQVRKTGSGLSVTLEDATVADLRKRTKLLSAKAGTTTIDAFAKRLVAAVPGARLVAFTGQKNLAPLAVGTVKDDIETYWDGLQRLASERGWRCFADRGTVYLGPDSWLLGRVPAVKVTEHTDGVEDINWDSDAGKKDTRASFEANINRWAAPPGTPVTVQNQGLASGAWLIETVSRSLFAVKGTISLVRKQPVIPEPKPEPRDDGGPSTLMPHGESGTGVKGPVSGEGFAWPLTGPLTSGFGQRNGRLHAGQDIGCPLGTGVHAAKAGTVTVSAAVSGYGNVIYLDHGDGSVTRYAHLSGSWVRPGQEVERGDLIALSGNTGMSTGPHLHFEIRIGGDAVDPLRYLPSRR